MDMIRAIERAKSTGEPWPYLKSGELVRIDGPAGWLDRNSGGLPQANKSCDLGHAVTALGRGGSGSWKCIPRSPPIPLSSWRPVEKCAFMGPFIQAVYSGL